MPNNQRAKKEPGDILKVLGINPNNFKKGEKGLEFVSEEFKNAIERSIDRDIAKTKPFAKESAEKTKAKTDITKIKPPIKSPGMPKSDPIHFYFNEQLQFLSETLKSNFLKSSDIKIRIEKEKVEQLEKYIKELQGISSSGVGLFLLTTRQLFKYHDIPVKPKERKAFNKENPYSSLREQDVEYKKYREKFFQTKEKMNESFVKLKNVVKQNLDNMDKSKTAQSRVTELYPIMKGLKLRGSFLKTLGKEKIPFQDLIKILKFIKKSDQKVGIKGRGLILDQLTNVEHEIQSLKKEIRKAKIHINQKGLLTDKALARLKDLTKQYEQLAKSYNDAKLEIAKLSKGKMGIPNKIKEIDRQLNKELFLELSTIHLDLKSDYKKISKPGGALSKREFLKVALENFNNRFHSAYKAFTQEFGLLLKAKNRKDLGNNLSLADQKLLILKMKGKFNYILERKNEIDELYAPLTKLTKKIDEKKLYPFFQKTLSDANRYSEALVNAMEEVEKLEKTLPLKATPPIKVIPPAIPKRPTPEELRQALQRAHNHKQGKGKK